MKSDFSAFALFTAGFAALTGAVNVARQNPTRFPELGQGVLAGSPFTITWDATTPGPVQIFLCVGPSINCVNQPAPLPGAESIPNSGTFVWTPSTSLLPTNGQGYGIFIKDLTTGEIQYTPQFGIVNPNAGSTIVVSQASSSILAVPTVTAVDTPSVPVITIVPTGTGSAVVPVVQPSAPLSVPTSLLTRPTSAPSAPAGPVFTPPPSNGAAKVGGSMAAIFGLALAAFAL